MQTFSKGNISFEAFGLLLIKRIKLYTGVAK